MRTLGLLGGMSWESTVSYYQLINRGMAERLGPGHAARLVIYSIEFQRIHALQHEDRWEEAGEILAGCAAKLEAAGAGAMLLCTNTMHRVAAQIEAAVQVPLLHIVDPTADALRAAGIREVGLLGTRFTMDQAFYRERLEARGLTVRLPGASERAEVNRVIYEELCRGHIEESSRRTLLAITGDLAARGAGGVILGCTELGLLLRPEDTGVRLFDTTALHAQRAVDWSLGED